jgi:hypothetical protein
LCCGCPSRWVINHEHQATPERASCNSTQGSIFENFWQGKGPYPILFAKPHIGKGKPWLRHSIAAQHADPQACLEEALAVAEYTMMDIDDGIPVARADLGVTLFPSFAGLAFSVADDTHPWPAEHWSLASYAAIPDIAAAVALLDGRGELPAALAVYRLLLERVDAGFCLCPMFQTTREYLTSAIS